MSYYFANKAEGKVEITDEQNNTYTLKQINSTSNQATAADSIMGGLSTMLDIVGWEVNDVVRVVNQDVVEGEDPHPPATQKTEPTLTATRASSSSATVTYDGDGQLFARAVMNSTPTATTINGTTVSFQALGPDDVLTLYLCSSEGVNYASKNVQVTIELP